MKVVLTVITDYCVQFPLFCTQSLCAGYSIETSSLPTDPLFCLEFINSGKDMNKVNSQKKNALTDNIEPVRVCSGYDVSFMNSFAYIHLKLSGILK